MTPELHPLTQKYPPMEADEFAAFQADLAAHGQKNPIWLFEGKVLDGRNRLRACLELGLDPLFAEFAGTEAEAGAFVDSQNLHRRHLSREWRQQRVREMRADGLSTHVIAEALGCSHNTVRRDLSSVGTRVPTEVVTPAVPPSVAPGPSPSSSPATISVGTRVPTEIPEPGRGSTNPCQSATKPIVVDELKSDRRPKPNEDLPRVQGRDGKSYRAERPAASKPQPAPKEKAQWSELASVLTELAQKVETLVPTPAENEKPWELISSLEATARSLLRQAERLKRRHHL